MPKTQKKLLDLSNMNEIPTHISQQWFSPEAKKLKTLAPIYLNLLLKQRGFNINDFHIRALDTGETSACYLLMHSEWPSVIKLKNTGAFAEAETLDTWYSQGVQVPKVLDTGTVRDQANNSDIQFLQLETICNQNNDEIAPLGYEFIDANLSRASELGNLMGKELAKMHSASSAHVFGRFGDIQGPVYPLWNGYLTDLLLQYREYFLSKGITESQLRMLFKRLTKITFPEKGSYIHGDFGIHNILVSQKQGIKVYVIDPDPQIGDPYFDVASILFRLQISKIMYDLNPSNTEIAYQYTKFTNCYQSLIDSYFSHSPEQYESIRDW
ncbi:MAG: hypothetical protein A3F30_00590 [Candidatus Levybacteria bacterium RIFCSPHIGHO2_12_FULL_37_12]|nr:MAG: hypothetical protein A3F30_00590 [Candidatus Levybacteria bacterium RIFCSPHIGHO2_12_FULL_37_12]